MTNIQQIEEEFDEKYGYEEIFVCQNCGHGKESHFWNGCGQSERAGYDACLVEGCECRCLSSLCDIKKIPVNQEIKSFYRHKIEELVRGLVPIEAKAKDDDQMARLGWNTCREMMLGRIKQAGIELTEE